MAKDNRPLLIVGLIILAVLFFQYSDFFGINLLSPQVQYNNQDIEARFKLINYTNPTINAFFDNEKIFEITANETNETITFTKDLINGTYVLKVMGIKEEGIFKFVVSEGNTTEIQVIEVRGPYVDITYNIPGVVDEDEIVDLEIETFTPQGEELDADSVDVEIIDPDNKAETISFDKSGNKFTKRFNYKENGNYQFKVKARKDGFETIEVTAITTVVKTGGIHPVVWVWIGAAIFWFILFGIKFARTKL